MRLLGVALDVELLVVCRLERGQAGSDGVVRPRLDLHVVRRVGVDQVDAGAIEQAVDVLGLGAVAAEQAMVAQDPQIAGACDWFVGAASLRRRPRAVRWL
jgi:hypothetical protein